MFRTVDHLFRHESGRMIAVLTRIFGIQNLQLAEDVVQEAFLKAMQSWKYGQLPNNPSAWLMQVARNKAVDIFRKRGKEDSMESLSSDNFMLAEEDIHEFFHQQEIEDSQLRMVFTTSHPLLKEEDRLALTLKAISGFSVSEIAKALLTTEDAVQKRLYRAKEFIRQHHIRFEIPAGSALTNRVDTVLAILYLLFNEGYNSLKADELIRKDLCAEAMRLCKILTEHPLCNKPETYALLSLMCFHAARFESRLDDNNGIILLQNQDRTKWNKELIHLGYHYLEFSAAGDQISVYHLESAIASEHCVASSYVDTRWDRMLELYDLLLKLKPSATVQLNRAVVLAEMGQIQEGINAILNIPQLDTLLKTQYIYSAVLGDLYKRLSDQVKARKFLEQAFQLTTSIAEKNLIMDKMKTIDPSKN